jgi:two-component system sensor histidine kinase KdpD
MRLRSTASRPIRKSAPRTITEPVDRPCHAIGAASTSGSADPPAAPASQSGPLAVSVIAHEFRAPLASLAAASELLLDDFSVLEPQQMRDMLAVIRDGTLWLQGMVENLLCAASIQAGHFRIHPEHLNLLEVVMETQTVVSPLLLQKDQALKLAVAGNVPSVLADRRWVGQAILNLVANASKYSANNSPISIRLTERDGHVRATVADRGPGIPEGRAAQLFEPFHRGEGAAAVDQGGVGLGLAIVKSVVDAHGGRVGAENRPRGGACIWLELPAAPCARAARLSTAQVVEGAI